MTRLIFEGVKVRADSPWSEELDGKEFYLDLNAFSGDLVSVNPDNTEEAIRSIKPLIGMDLAWNNSVELKDSLLAAALSVLDRQAQCNKKPKGRTYELLSEMTGISHSYCRAYLKEKRLSKIRNLQNDEEENIKKSWEAVRKAMDTLLEHINDYEWCETIESLSEERKEAEQIITMLEEKIIQGDEKMKKMTVDYLLEDRQCEYLSRIRKHFPHVSEEDLFLAIMTEGSAMEIDCRMNRFCSERGIDSGFKYHS